MPDTTSPYNKANALAGYIVDTVFKELETNRQNTLETKWNDARDNFQAVVSSKWKQDEAEGVRSQTFVNETRQKVMAAYSILIDTMLAGGRIPFMLNPSPWDNVVIEDLPEDQQDLIRDSIEDMTGVIQQQLRDCNADRSLMRNLLSLCEYGETYAKRSVIEVVRKGYKRVVIDLDDAGITDVSRVPETLDQYERTEDRHDSPSWDYVSIWDIYRDLETDDLREGHCVMQRRYVSPYWLRQRKGGYLYLDDDIEMAIKTAQRQDANKLPSANQSSLPPYLRDIQIHKRTILYLEFWGRLPRKVVEEYESELGQRMSGVDGWEPPSLVFSAEDELDGDEIECMVCVAGGYVVRYARTTPDMRPFFRAVFEENLDELGARGIAENVSDQQKILNGVHRAIEDNMKLSSNVILATMDDLIQGRFDKVIPGMRIHLQPEAAQSNTAAITPILIPNVTEPLMRLAELVRNNLDEESMVPRTLQGIQVDKGRDTAYEISQRVERAGKYLAQVIRNVDEGLIEPIITEFYEYNMMDPGLDAGKKGNYIVKALGFTSYQDRVTKINNIRALIEIAERIAPVAAEMAWRQITEIVTKSLDLDIDSVLLTRQDKARAEEQGQDQAAAMAAEKLAAETDKLRADAEAKRAGIKLDAARTEIDRAEQIRKAEETEAKLAATGIPMAPGEPAEPAPAPIEQTPAIPTEPPVIEQVPEPAQMPV